MCEPSPTWALFHLTDMQHRILGVICQYRCEHPNYGPTLDEIAQRAGLASKSTASYHVRRLAALGIITYAARVPRSIAIAKGALV